MKIKKDKGFVGVDAAIAIAAVVIFSGLIISLMYNNFLENVKIKREALATIYLTEFFENIAIADYDDVLEENISTLIPEQIVAQGFIMNEEDIQIVEDEQEKITKKITATISYELNEKTYEHTMERIKIKE